MIGNRIRLFRLSRGLSQDQLVAETGGVVTKASISKYERGIAKPSPRILTKLAKALDTKVAKLLSEPQIKVKRVAYRKKVRLAKKEEARIESIITKNLEDWTSLQEIVEVDSRPSISIHGYPINSLDETENAAIKLRKEWNLGFDPIANIVNTLEENKVFVVNIESDRNFDGMSAVAIDKGEKVKAAAVISRVGVCGERQRLSLAHELGHIVLDVSNQIDEEKAAYRFGSAFLAPAQLLYHDVGRKRSSITLSELILLKQRFGLSMQAIVYRLKDLNIINQSLLRKCFILINMKGWKDKEPFESEPEAPQWLKITTYRALSESLISAKKAEQLLGEKIEYKGSTSSLKLRAFAKLPSEKRNEILQKQVSKYGDEYLLDSDWLSTGDWPSEPDEQ